MAKLSDIEMQALAVPPMVGFSTGSNMWPLVQVQKTAESPVIDGEVFDGLLRSGLIWARILEQPVITDTTRPNPDYPHDCECTHHIELTDAGRAALQEAGR